MSQHMIDQLTVNFLTLAIICGAAFVIYSFYKKNTSSKDKGKSITDSVEDPNKNEFKGSEREIGQHLNDVAEWEKRQANKKKGA